MNGLCLTESLLNYAIITCDKENYTKLYNGICETTFKKCFANHKKSFNVTTYKSDKKFCVICHFFNFGIYFVASYSIWSMTLQYLLKLGRPSMNRNNFMVRNFLYIFFLLSKQYIPK